MPGYTLDGTTTWTFDVLRGPNCVLPLATPLAASAHCESSADSVLATYTIPVRTGVDYFVDGVRTPAGTYRAGSRSVVHVNAVARPGFELVPGVRRAWTFSFASIPDCVLSHDEHHRDLPVTGDSTGLLTLAGLSALASGGSLTAVGSRCRPARRTR
jgi:LPXTG-motif cell wall-anchored protein